MYVNLSQMTNNKNTNILTTTSFIVYEENEWNFDLFFELICYL